MSVFVKQIQDLKEAIAKDEQAIGKRDERLSGFYGERAELVSDLERLATVRSELVAMAAHSDEAYAKLRPHDRNVAELVQRKEDLDAMVEQLERERADHEAARRASQDVLSRTSELYLRQLGKQQVAELAEQLRERLTTCALVHRRGAHWERSWADSKAELANALFPSDPRTLDFAEANAILHRVTGGLLGAPLTR